eukprot:1195653-Prorocentrum_minimum.AAC.2
MKAPPFVRPVYFCTFPNNDFTSLFLLANGLAELPVDCPPLSSDPNIFFTGVGRSFFEQCLPKESVDLCTSFTAVHWLSRLPAVLKDSVHHTLSADSSGAAKFAVQANADWETVLGHRAAELRKGGQVVWLYQPTSSVGCSLARPLSCDGGRPDDGRMGNRNSIQVLTFDCRTSQGVIATLAKDPAGRYLGWNGKEGTANMYGELNKCWDAMLAEGLISTTEHDSATFCNYYRTEEELRAPFEVRQIAPLEPLLPPLPTDLATRQLFRHHENDARGSEFEPA